MATAANPSLAAAPMQEGSSGPLYVDTQHDDMVHDAQLDYYGCKLATSSSDSTIKIYNVSGASYEHTATLQGHEGPVWQVSWAHPKFGVVLASCSFDGSVLIHRETRPREWTLLYAAKHLHSSSVNGLAFCPHEYGLMLAAASSDGKVSILAHQPDNSWSFEYLQDCALGVNSVSWAPSGAYDDGLPRLMTGGCDNGIRLWKRSDEMVWEEDVKMETEHSDWVRDVAWAPPILPNVNVVASCSEDGKVLIWTSEKKEDQAERWKSTLLNDFGGPVWRVSWSLTAQLLAVSSGDSDVSLWKQGLDGVWSQMDTMSDTAATLQEG
eukprot:CAMPEP_0194229022 /NCGR_PEP_ID=MMETSP0156-20130528/43674_1 /TAXON_ID=33649 /ORGANISM="Thalassionema nitzschioides, Strain L26-B" /LENGTH=322 /DNA_ID=CAMNT_0038961557 /DNA_START=16 /DNA_END=984 /DNA_ORIENTATION=+